MRFFQQAGLTFALQMLTLAEIQRIRDSIRDWNMDDNKNSPFGIVFPQIIFVLIYRDKLQKWKWIRIAR
jgi:hypothetical protein